MNKEGFKNALKDKVNAELVNFYNDGYLQELAEKYSIDYATKIVPCFKAL